MLVDVCVMVVCGIVHDVDGAHAVIIGARIGERG